MSLTVKCRFCEQRQHQLIGINVLWELLWLEAFTRISCYQAHLENSVPNVDLDAKSSETSRNLSFGFNKVGPGPPFTFQGSWLSPGFTGAKLLGTWSESPPPSPD